VLLRPTHRAGRLRGEGLAVDGERESLAYAYTRAPQLDEGPNPSRLKACAMTSKQFDLPLTGHFPRPLFRSHCRWTDFRRARVLEKLHGRGRDL